MRFCSKVCCCSAEDILFVDKKEKGLLDRMDFLKDSVVEDVVGLWERRRADGLSRISRMIV